MSAVLENQVAIVTGAGQGLGRTFALRFAQEGAALLLADINLDNVEQTARQIEEKGGRAVAVQVDISKEQDAKLMADEVIARYGQVDILFNNAANTQGVGSTPWDAWTVEAWDRIFAVNARGTWLCCKAIAPLMTQRGKGKIINMASDIFKLPGAQMGLAYACSKAAICTLTQTLARVLGPSGVCVNAIAPGLTATESAVQQTAREAFEATLALQSIKRREEPADLEGTAVFLASSASDFITGQVIIVDGGALMQ